MPRFFARRRSTTYVRQPRTVNACPDSKRYAGRCSCRRSYRKALLIRLASSCTKLFELWPTFRGPHSTACLAVLDLDRLRSNLAGVRLGRHGRWRQAPSGDPLVPVQPRVVDVVRIELFLRRHKVRQQSMNVAIGASTQECFFPTINSTAWSIGKVKKKQQVQHPAVEFRVAVQIVSRPSDHFQVQNRLFRRLSGAAGSQPDHRFSRNSPSGRSSRRLPSANLKSCVIKRRPRQVPHLWIFVRTVRQCSAAGGRLSLQVGQIGFACSRVVLLARWRLPQKPIACFFCAVR